MSINTSLMQSVPPNNIQEIVSLEDTLLQTHTDAGIEDNWFIDRIKGGINLVEDYTKLSLTPQTWVLRVDGEIPSKIDLPRSPVRKILSVKYQSNVKADPITIDNAILINESIPAQLVIPNGFNGGGILRIEYECGYDPDKVPSAIRDAILLYVSWAYENRAGEVEIPKAFYYIIEKYRLFST